MQKADEFIRFFFLFRTAGKPQVTRTVFLQRRQDLAHACTGRQLATRYAALELPDH